MRVLRLHRVPILEQLRLEEALLKANHENWCVLNQPPEEEGSVVLGIGGKPAELVHLDNAQKDNIPLIKRFSGGGTVFMDENVRCVSFIVNSAALPELKSFPRPIMDWTGGLYEQVFHQLNVPGFSLRDHDYCLGQKKFGGNAQSIVRDRWLHHTSFLWTPCFDMLERYLQFPRKVPEYRAGRSHTDFTCGLGTHFEGGCDAAFSQAVLTALEEYFILDNTVTVEEAQLHLEVE